jgi:hypothetical protein
MANTELTPTLKKPSKLRVWEQALETFQGGFFAVLHVFFLKDTWLSFMQHGIGKFIFGPISTVLLLVKWGVSFVDLLIAKNKNLGRVAQLALNSTVLVLSASFFAVSLAASLLGSAVLAAVTPFLLTGLLGVLAISNVALALFHGYKLFTTPKDDPETKKRYRQAFVRSLFAGILLTALTVTVGLLTIFKIAPVAMAVASVGIAAGGFVFCVLGSLLGIKNYRSEKRQREDAVIKMKGHINTESSSDLEQGALAKNSQSVDSVSQQLSIEEKGSSSNTGNLVSDASFKPKRSWSDYYYQANRARELSTKLRQGGNIEQLGSYLSKEISDKIASLEKQPSTGFFEQGKRAAKIELLKDLETLLPKNDGSNQQDQELKLKAFNDKVETTLIFKSLDEYLQNDVYRQRKDKACQSFFRATGDVEDILAAVELFSELNSPKKSNQSFASELRRTPL